MDNADTEKLIEEVADGYSGKTTGRAKNYLVAARILAAIYLFSSAGAIFFGDSGQKISIAVSTFFLGVPLAGLIMARSWAVPAVGVVARIYGVLYFLTFLFPGTMWSDSFRLTAATILLVILLYFSSLDFIPSVREYAGLSRRTFRKTIFLAGFYLSFPVILTVVYMVFITNMVPVEIRKIRTHPFSELEAIYTPPSSPDRYEWRSGKGYFLNRDMKPFVGKNGTVIPDSWRKNGEGGMRVTSGVAYENKWVTRMGFDDAFSLEKAVNNADLPGGWLLWMKKVTRLNFKQETVYLFENSVVKAVVHFGQVRENRWSTVADIYPVNDSSFEMTSNNRDPNESLAPVMMTIERYRKGGEENDKGG